MSKNKPKLRKADGQCNKLASSAELSRLSTDDLSQFITLSVQLCVERDACKTARRAGPSADTRYSWQTVWVGLRVQQAVESSHRPSSVLH